MAIACHDPRDDPAQPLVPVTAMDRNPQQGRRQEVSIDGETRPRDPTKRVAKAF
jgi:hypothetical protein